MITVRFVSGKLLRAALICNVFSDPRTLLPRRSVGVLKIHYRIRAARKSFPETNLTVITADGKLHHFYLIYSDQPTNQTFWIDSLNNIQFEAGINVRDFERKAYQILDRNGGNTREKGKV